jgi:hypothetical protein
MNRDGPERFNRGKREKSETGTLFRKPIEEIADALATREIANTPKGQNPPKTPRDEYIRQAINAFAPLWYDAHSMKKTGQEPNFSALVPLGCSQESIDHLTRLLKDQKMFPGIDT